MKSRYLQFLGAFLLAIVLMSTPVVAQASPAALDADSPVTSTLDLVGQWWNQILVVFGFGQGDGNGNAPQAPSGMVPTGGENLTTETLTDATDTDVTAGIDPSG